MKLRWRDEFLAEFGLIWILLGFTYATRDPVPLGLEPVTGHYVTLDVWAGVWVATGAYALVCAVRPSRRNGSGFLALAFMPGVWAGSYLTSFISYLVTGRGLAQGLTVALVWILLARAVNLVARRDDPPEGL